LRQSFIVTHAGFKLKILLPQLPAPLHLAAILEYTKNVELYPLKECIGDGHQWLMPVILVTQEAEIRRIVVRSQLGQIVRETLPQKKKLHKKGLVKWLKV
jgi:hypothetical protein